MPRKGVFSGSPLSPFQSHGPHDMFLQSMRASGSKGGSSSGTAQAKQAAVAARDAVQEATAIRCGANQSFVQVSVSEHMGGGPYMLPPHQLLHYEKQ